MPRPLLPDVPVSGNKYPAPYPAKEPQQDRRRTVLTGCSGLKAGNGTCLGLYGQRQMNSHLVAVEVRVESGTYQRMQLDCLAFNQNGLKGLDTQSVQGRHGSALQDAFLITSSSTSHTSGCSLYHLLGILYIVGGSVGNQLLHNKGLKQLNGHFLRRPH